MAKQVVGHALEATRLLRGHLKESFYGRALLPPPARRHIVGKYPQKCLMGIFGEPLGVRVLHKYYVCKRLQ